MKNLSRKARKIALGALLSAVVAMAACLDLVDHTPYFRTGYYAETISRRDSALAQVQLSRGELEAGFGRARLTPTINAEVDDPTTGKFRAIPLAGYGDREGKPATGVHDDLWVKAVALRVGDRVGLLFGIDALIVPREVAEHAAAALFLEFRLKREQLYFSATHTHCSIGGWGEGVVAELFAGPFNPASRTWFAGQIVSAAREAMTDLKPAEFGHGNFQAPEFIRNRLVGDRGEVDPEFSFCVVQQTQGATAILGSYSAHATVLSSSTMEFSGDYPGFWQQALEKDSKVMALFLAGGVGSHAPVAPGKAFDGAARMGNSLAEEALEQIERTPLTNSIAFGFAGLRVALPPLNVRLTDGVRLRPWLAAQLVPKAQDTFVQAFRMADSVWLSTPCDYSGELALRLKDMLRARGRQGVVTSFNGDYIGYVIPAKYYHLNGYEPRIMSFYGPNVPDYLEEMLASLARMISQ